MIRRAFELLIRFKNDLKKVSATEALSEASLDEGAVCQDVTDEDDEPLTWAEQKGIRRELRRFQLWHALRRKVPRGFEEGV